MQLTKQQIKDLTSGVCDFYTENDCLHFIRMTEKTSAAFTDELERFKTRKYGTPGVRFDFITDSEFVSLEVAD